MCRNRSGLVRKRRMRKTMKMKIFFTVKAATMICALFLNTISLREHNQLCSQE